MSTSGHWLAWPLALALYAAPPAVLHGWRLSEPIGLAAELMALIVLLLATRLALVLAGSTMLAVLPIAILAGTAGDRLVLETGLIGLPALLLAAAVAILVGGLIVTLWLSLTASWRPAAIAGFSLTLGALTLALCAQLASASVATAWELLLPGGGALLAALAVQAWISRSAAQASLRIAAQEPDYRDALGMPIERLARQVLMVAGLLAGLAAIPLFASPLAEQPHHWPALWFGLLATVMLAGRNAAVDALYVGLPVLLLPRLLREFMPHLPDLTLPVALLALLVATLGYRGRRPGEPLPPAIHGTPP